MKLLRGLFDSRLMTLAHAASLYFEGRIEAAKKRVQKLKAAGLVGMRIRKPYEPAILFLTQVGHSALNQKELLRDVPRFSWPALEKRLQVSDLTLKHELAVMDVKAAICSAVDAASNLTVTEFSTWPLLFQFEACPGNGPDVLVKPDGFIRIGEEDADGAFEHVFFLELDRSTETLDTLGRRALCYLDFYQRGGLAERFGGLRSAYKDYPFRVLLVFSTAERRNNIAERLLIQQPPILTQVWLSTLKEIVANPMGLIWLRPRDYREAVEGTQFKIGKSKLATVYRRQQERELLINSTAIKHRLFNATS